eukprot:765456-Hanusia_phi.AAC.7
MSRQPRKAWENDRMKTPLLEEVEACPSAPDLPGAAHGRPPPYNPDAGATQSAPSTNVHSYTSTKQTHIVHHTFAAPEDLRESMIQNRSIQEGNVVVHVHSHRHLFPSHAQPQESICCPLVCEQKCEDSCQGFRSDVCNFHCDKCDSYLSHMGSNRSLAVGQTLNLKRFCAVNRGPKKGKYFE